MRPEDLEIIFSLKLRSDEEGNNLFIQRCMRPEDLEIIFSLKLRSDEEGNNYIEGSADQAADEVIERYKELKSRGLNGDFGETPQY